MRAAAFFLLTASVVAACTAFRADNTPAATDPDAATPPTENDAGGSTTTGDAGGTTGMTTPPKGQGCAGRDPMPTVCDDYEEGSFMGASQIVPGDSTLAIGAVGRDSARGLHAEILPNKTSHAYQAFTIGNDDTTQITWSFDIHIDDRLRPLTELTQLYFPLPGDTFCGVQTRRSANGKVFELNEYCKENDVERSITKVDLPTDSGDAYWLSVTVDTDFKARTVQVQLISPTGLINSGMGKLTMVTFTPKSSVDPGIGYAPSGSGTAADFDNFTATWK